MENKQKNILVYETEEGTAPFEEWLNQLRDLKAKSIILSRLDRLQLGLFGDSKFVGEGVFELRIAFSAGYRVYFAQEDNNIILLLCGGDKNSQDKDIDKAQKYLKDYRRRG